MTRYTTPPCPADEAHGPLLAWVSADAGFYCPNHAHTGNPFYRTDLSPATRSALDGPPDSRSARTRRGLSGSSATAASLVIAGDPPGHVAPDVTGHSLGL